MPELLLQPEHQVEDPDPDRDVEHRDRLVREDHRRVDGERARDRDALALPPGELVRILRGVHLGRHEAHRAQQLVDPRRDVAPRDDAVDPHGALEVVPDRPHRIQRVEGVLEDHLHPRAVELDVAAAEDVRPVVDHRARRRVVQPREDARDGALAAAALADERRDRALAKREAHVVDRAQLPEVLGQRADVQLGGAHERDSSTRWQATSWPGATGLSTGRSVVWRV